MGYYIEVPNKKGKAKQLVFLHGAKLLPMRPEEFGDVPEDKALICVVDNGPFEAANLVPDDERFIHIADTPDQREMWWLLMDKTLAHKLAGYT